MEAENEQGDHPIPSSGLPEGDISEHFSREVQVRPLERPPSAVEQSAEYWVDLLTQGPPSKSTLSRTAREVRPPTETVPTISGSMVGAVEAARICGISRTTWYSLKAAGRVPAPVHLGRRVLWRREELHDWMTAGCPPLYQWQRSKEQHTRASRRGER